MEKLTLWLAVLFIIFLGVDMVKAAYYSIAGTTFQFLYYVVGGILDYGILKFCYRRETAELKALIIAKVRRK